MKQLLFWSFLCLAISCSPPKAKCTAANCAGCCDSLGLCQSGSLATACGGVGTTCQACFPGQSCSLGSCINGNNGGGNSGVGGGNSGVGGGGGQAGGTATGGGQSGQGGGASTCNSTTCASGCCQGNVCVVPGSQSSLACGSGGFACVPCGNGFSCSAGSCQTSGTGGGAGGGGAATCNFGNCSNGCCSGTTCIPSSAQNVAGCGQGGSLCSPCLSGQSCTNGTCMTSGTGGGSGAGGGTGTGGGSVASCSAANCNGCCVGATCIPAASQTANNCGSTGATCAACPSGNSCNGGFCTPPNAQYGSPCNATQDCVALGGNYTCKRTTSTGNATYSGGYCTRFCTTATDCGTGSSCVGLTPEYGESDAICWKTCAVATDCRTGYACYGLSSGSACWLSPLPPIDAGTPANKLGNACSNYLTCANPPDPQYAACLTPFFNLADGGTSSQPTGYVGGYCTAVCSVGGQPLCGSNGICLGNYLGDGDDYCVQKCTSPWAGQSSCRVGYRCAGYNTVDSSGNTTPAPDGFCDPSCFNAGAGCSDAGYCDAGYCLAK